MLRYISIFREKYNRHFITGFGYKLVTELTTCKFTHGISIIEQTSILFARTKIQFHYDIYSLVNQSLFIATCAQQRSVLLYYPTIDTTKRREAYWTFFIFGGHHGSN